MALGVIMGDDEARSNMSRDDRLWGYSPASGRVQAFAAGYFLWDVLLCVRHLDVQGVSALLHAVAALIITVTGFVSFYPPPSKRKRVHFPPKDFGAH